jgi:hypothetical protein
VTYLLHSNILLQRRAVNRPSNRDSRDATRHNPSADSLLRSRHDGSIKTQELYSVAKLQSHDAESCPGGVQKCLSPAKPNQFRFAAGVPSSPLSAQQTNNHETTKRYLGSDHYASYFDAILHEMSNLPRSQPSQSRLSTVPSQKPRQLSHLQAQLAQLTANMADLESLMRMTAGQAQDMRGLGGYAGGL